MARIQVPPPDEDFTADPSELFFDLAYVFAFSQIVGVLVHHPDWVHVGRMTLLFLLLWLPWQQFTWAADAVPGNSRPVRLVILVGTVVSVPMAASVGDAYGSGGPLFAVSIVGIFLLGVGLLLVANDRSSATFRSATTWTGINSVALVLLLVGAFLDGSVRVAMWCASLAITIFATWLGGRGEWTVRPGHFAERHGLITIVALGEVIVAIGLPVVDSLQAGDGVPIRTIAVLAATGVFAALIWWAYFDRISPALEYRAEHIEDPIERANYVRTVYTWLHAPIVAGIVSSAAGLEYLALHPTQRPPMAFRLLLAGGLMLAALGIVAGIWVAFRGIAYERIVAAVVFGIVATALPVDGLWLIVIIDIAIFAAIMFEHRRIEVTG